MKEQVTSLLHAAPFEPFAVEIASDVAWSIPTPDHAFASKNALVIEDDDGILHIINYKYIRQIVTRSAA